MTANNVTYGAVGEMIGYWTFFPAPEGWGRIPVWGFGDVVRSQHGSVAVGERLYGYFPMSQYLVLRPERVSAGGFVDATPHRAALPPVYNQYTRVSRRPGRDPGSTTAIFRPLFATSFLLDDFLEENGLFGARSVVLSSASSKTALGLAFLLTQAKRCPVIGLTSTGNRDFVARTGYYATRPHLRRGRPAVAGRAGVFVDFAGNASVVRSVHSHLGDALKQSISGRADALGADGAAVRPAGADAGVLLRTRSREEADGRLGARPSSSAASLVEAMGRFLASASPWLRVVEGQGPAALESVYKRLVEGRVTRPKATCSRCKRERGRDRGAARHARARGGSVGRLRPPRLRHDRRPRPPRPLGRACASLPALEPLSHPAIIAIATALYVAEFVAEGAGVRLGRDGSTPSSASRAPRCSRSRCSATSRSRGGRRPRCSAARSLCPRTALKAGTRLAANASPEPFSNWLLSFGEDAAVDGPSCGWRDHPLLLAALAATVVLVAALSVRWMLRALRRLLAPARRRHLKRGARATVAEHDELKQREVLRHHLARRAAAVPPRVDVEVVAAGRVHEGIGSRAPRGGAARPRAPCGPRGDVRRRARLLAVREAHVDGDLRVRAVDRAREDGDRLARHAAPLEDRDGELVRAPGGARRCSSSFASSASFLHSATTIRRPIPSRYSAAASSALARTFACDTAITSPG